MAAGLRMTKIHTAELACGCKRKFSPNEERQWRRTSMKDMGPISCPTADHGDQRIVAVSGDTLQLW